jgi:hypothetical protein
VQKEGRKKVLDDTAVWCFQQCCALQKIEGLYSKGRFFKVQKWLVVIEGSGIDHANHPLIFLFFNLLLDRFWSFVECQNSARAPPANPASSSGQREQLALPLRSANFAQLASGMGSFVGSLRQAYLAHFLHNMNA